MSTDFTAEQLEIFKDTFLQFDKDGDQSISTKELGTVMRALGMDVTEAELNMMIAEVDSDNSGSIEFDEFLTMVAYRIRDTDIEEETRMAFRLFDERGTGFISCEEIKQIMTSLGECLTMEGEVKEMLSRMDLNEGGMVNYERLIKKMMGGGRKQCQMQLGKDRMVLRKEGPQKEGLIGSLPGPSSGKLSGVGYGLATQVDSYGCTRLIREENGC